jgi:uracil-DNA glycosylase family protein
MASPKAPGAEQWIPPELTLPALKSAAQGCRGCDLYEAATQAVLGSGPADAAMMVVGEQPGDKEDKQGEPFVGPAGKLLDEALAAAGIDPGSVFRTNVVKHFRWESRGKQRIHKSPSRTHIIACQPWFLAELALVRPTGIVLLGGSAGKAVYGSSFRVGAARGSLQAWPDGTPPKPSQGRPDWVLTTIHPSAVLRSRTRNEDFDQLVADLHVAARELD